MAPGFYRALESVSNQHSISFIYHSYHLPMQDPSPSNADSLKLQLLTARKKEWWPTTAESLKLPTSYSSEEGVVAGHSGQFTPGGYLSTL